MSCGICQRPAVAVGTVPMCGKRPRYPLCQTCLADLEAVGYVVDVRPIDMGGDR